MLVFEMCQKFSPAWDLLFLLCGSMADNEDEAQCHLSKGTRKAVEELLKEAKRGRTRAETMGAMGWLKCPLAGTNKRFLINTIKNTLPSQKEQDQEREQKEDEGESATLLQGTKAGATTQRINMKSDQASDEERRVTSMDRRSGAAWPVRVESEQECHLWACERLASALTCLSESSCQLPPARAKAELCYGGILVHELGIALLSSGKVVILALSPLETARVSISSEVEFFNNFVSLSV
ncbi:hypothetical protein IHE44_0005468 [Lamprotornis superbus]|uniref:Uncharacterized protein n=1 Tax=Lamprotornis superbus TaxID=245042 RepID=A0A835NUG5_9PASS|nr:hypothetical protein IHE44_0005468 [Lamprotornis superbus]